MHTERQRAPGTAGCLRILGGVTHAAPVTLLERYDDRMSAEKRADHLRRIYLEVRTLAKTLSQLAQIKD